MNSQELSHFNEMLRHLADSLDIPPELRDRVEDKYHEISGFLLENDSSLQSATPDLYPQGSFALGTVVRPISDDDDYDIDMVCCLHLKKESVTQQELKERIGNRLSERKDLKEILSESRRCWRLDFEEGFHMDVLPAIPDLDVAPHDESILITDTELRNWQHSNPKDYASWFRRQMQVAFERERYAMAASLRASVEKIPDYQVKTPLQRAVQLLKRHRDVHFQDDLENRPVSIILTTLAALAYSNEDNLYDALLAIVRKMPDHIEYEKGKWRVRNPVNKNENFADKWNEYPKRRDKFMKWLDKVESDFEFIASQRGPDLLDALKAPFGSRLVSRAAKLIGNTYFSQSQSGALQMATSSGTLGVASALSAFSTIPVPRHTFYGEIQNDEAD